MREPTLERSLSNALIATILLATARTCASTSAVISKSLSSELSDWYVRRINDHKSIITNDSNDRSVSSKSDQILNMILREERSQSTKFSVVPGLEIISSNFL